MIPKITLRKRLFARFMKNDEEFSFQQYKDKKHDLFRNLNGKVLEIGPGTGVNFPFYTKEIEWFGIEPNPAMQTFLIEKAESLDFDISKLYMSLKDTQIKDNYFDSVVSTLALCSVPNLQDMLEDILKVLKPGGSYLFIEHVIDKPWKFRRCIQNIVPYTPWRYFSDGCNPNRDIGHAIRNCGFTEVNITEYMQEGEGVILSITRPHIYGYAIK